MTRKKINYLLVGSVYNKFSKEQYQREMIVQIPNVNLNSLEAIDYYTSGLSIAEFYQALPELLQNKNMFSIRVENTDNQTYYYTKAIFSDPELHRILQQVKKKKVLLTNGYKTLSLVPSCTLVNKCWEKIETALKNRDIETLEQYFSSNSSYYFKLIRHLNSGYDYGIEERALEDLKLEFRNYHIFRKVYITQKKNNIIASNYMHIISPEKHQPPENQFPYSDAEYRAHRTHQFNTQSDKEEFLEPDEYAECNPYFDDPGPQLIKKPKENKKIYSSKDEN